MVESAGVKRHVARELDRVARQGDGRRVEQMDGQYRAKTHEQRVHELRSIAAVLKDDPTKRTTAAHALGEEDTRRALPENIGGLLSVLTNVRCPLSASLLCLFRRRGACSSLAGCRKAARSHWRDGWWATRRASI